ncbi:MAG: redox-sensing transcriptional repressor Rex [Ruminococcaceae bacterium]|nr:redox-sensing transcriptional repressor Rex [Oscillospiraceae bacterium]
MNKAAVSRATLGRLPMYLKYLREADGEYISATVIARALDLGEVLVRKDLNAISGSGKPRIGYEKSALICSIEKWLGGSKKHNAVLVGAGKLGKALLDFDEFEKYGVDITAAFDCNDKVIRLGSSREILPMEQFDEYCRTHEIHIGIITVGEGSAQLVCERMINSGITAIWNFAPCKLKVPDGVILMQENLALSLAYLINRLRD